MNAITFQLRLLQPVLVSQIGSGEENSSTAHDYIPASTIRGALIKQYLAKHSGEDISVSEWGRKLFFDGTVCYLNGYIGDSENNRMLPKPLSWRISKRDELQNNIDVHDFAINPIIDIPSPKQPRGNYIAHSKNKATIKSPSRYVQVHNSSEKRYVKQSGDSSVFRYDALAKDQIFSAAIISDDMEALEKLKLFLVDKTLVLGGSRSAEYGQVLVEQVEIKSNWVENSESQEAIGKLITITLLSDTILRGEDGQYTLSLRPILGVDHIRAFVKSSVTGGFNRKWGLPLPQSIAMLAGSVFVYQADQVDLQKLRELQSSGIGERCVEGYGRFAINWIADEKITWERTLNESVVPQQNTYPIAVEDEESRKLLQRIVERRLRSILDRNLANAVATLSISGNIKNAQLSRLRLAANEAYRNKKFEPITIHLSNLKDARRQLEHSRIANRPLINWLEDGLEGNLLWIDYLQPDDSEIPELEGFRAEVSDELKVEYVARLLDGLFSKTSRFNQQGGE